MDSSTSPLRLESPMGLRRQINSIVLEYLNFHNYVKASKVFSEEVAEKADIVPSPGVLALGSLSEIQKQQMMESFERGDASSFFFLFDSLFLYPNVGLASSKVPWKLLIELHAYFAIQPLLDDDTTSTRSMAICMGQFRHFIEQYSSKFVSNAELLPYFALPFVSNPRSHPSFSRLFQPEWLSALRSLLEQFISENLDKKSTEPEPTLHACFTGWQVQQSHAKRSPAPSRSSSPVMDSKGSGGNGMGSSITTTATASSSLSPSHSAAVDHDKMEKILSIAHDLIAQLDKASKGTLVGRSTVDDFILRLRLIEQRGVPVPASASSATAPVASGSSSGAASSGVGAGMAASSAASSFSNGSGGDRQSYRSVVTGGAPPQAAFSINFEAVHLRFRKGLDREIALLLQALRWRIMAARPGHDRRHIFLGMLQQDVLGVNVIDRVSVQGAPPGETAATKPRRLIVELLRSSSPILVESLVRFINVVSCHSAGRLYLVFSAVVKNVRGAEPEMPPLPLIVELCRILKAQDSETPLLRNALGALQKCSLRRRAQAEMVRRDVIKWLVGFLKNTENLSEYSVEYATALLMNLALRFDGKRKCDEVGDGLLLTLMDLLEYDNPQVRTYVNGMLYSILTVGSIRERARGLGLGDLLSLLMDRGDDHQQQQLEYVLQQLELEDKNAPTENQEQYDDDDDAADDTAEDSELVREGEYDEFDDDEDETLQPVADEVQGEELLKEFAGTSVSRVNSTVSVRSGDRPPVRPSTPRQNGGDARSRAAPPSSSGPAQATAARQPVSGAPQPSRKALEKLQSSGNNIGSDPLAEYAGAFGSRTKILRTPAAGDQIDL
eukprot:ANDGO_05445.mRNA.1 LisH domain-containing protein ARMC9 OS=Pongo abelii GN=ARMC9 PE=2 SV=1